MMTCVRIISAKRASQVDNGSRESKTRTGNSVVVPRTCESRAESRSVGGTSTVLTSVDVTGAGGGVAGGVAGCETVGVSAEYA